MLMLRAAGKVHLVRAVEGKDRARAAQLLDMRMAATAAAEAELTPKTRPGQLPRGMLTTVMEVPAAALRRVVAPQATPDAAPQTVQLALRTAEPTIRSSRSLPGLVAPSKEPSAPIVLDTDLSEWTV
jgi:hypothetical protein